MKVLVLGCGRIGSVAAEDIAKSLSSVKVVVADVNAEKAKGVARKIGKDNVSWVQLDASNHEELIEVLKGFDLAMGFLPAGLGYGLIKACISVGTNLVDVSYIHENPLTLNEEAAKARVTVIPDCGLAPGLSNILVGHAAEELDEVKTAHIMVGGLPESPIPPLDYIVTWSPESLIDEYTRAARLIKDGEVVEVEALSGSEEVEIPGVGRLEAFYTDGLRTLLYTMKGVDEMWEKTLRHPGHAEKMKMLRDLGFFDKEEVDVEGIRLQPRRLTAKLFERKLCKPNVKDVVVLNVEVSGVRGGVGARYVYRLVDYYDAENQVTAMARATAYTASATAQLMLEGVVKREGVVPPEALGADEVFFKEFLSYLKTRGLKITEEKFPIRANT